MAGQLAVVLAGGVASPRDSSHRANHDESVCVVLCDAGVVWSIAVCAEAVGWLGRGSECLSRLG